MATDPELWQVWAYHMMWAGKEQEAAREVALRPHNADLFDPSTVFVRSAQGVELYERCLACLEQAGAAPHEALRIRKALLRLAAAVDSTLARYAPPQLAISAVESAESAHPDVSSQVQLAAYSETAKILLRPREENR